MVSKWSYLVIMACFYFSPSAACLFMLDEICFIFSWKLVVKHKHVHLMLHVMRWQYPLWNLRGFGWKTEMQHISQRSLWISFYLLNSLNPLQEHCAGCKDKRHEEGWWSLGRAENIKLVIFYFSSLAYSIDTAVDVWLH